MRLSLANLRLGQQLLTTPVVKDVFRNLMLLLPESVQATVSSRTLRTIWSPHLNEESAKERDQDIADIKELNSLAGGHWIIGKTISYLNDRYVYFLLWSVSLFQKWLYSSSIFHNT